MGLTASLDAMNRRKIPLHYRDSNLVRPAYSIVAIPTEIPLRFPGTAELVVCKELG
jgi:hypothetical protein